MLGVIPSFVKRGSSPLTRGAPRCVCVTVGLLGLIPADAGSTFVTPGWWSSLRAHPR